MLSTDVLIEIPADATATRKAGRKHVDVHDERIKVTLRDHGCRLELFFDSPAYDASLLELRLLPDGTRFEPQPFIPRAPLYVRYARAAMAMRDDDQRAARDALRLAGGPRRGLPDAFFKLIAESYAELQAEGVKHPIKVLAEQNHADISTASRWVKRARELGYITEGGK